MAKDLKKAHKRSEAQIAADLAFIEHWIVRGKTMRQLVVMLAAERPYTLCRQQIQADAIKVKEMWEQEALTSRTEAITAELKRLKAVDDEAWTALEKSKLDKTTKTVEETEGQKAGSKAGKKKKIVAEGQNADAAYLRVIQENVVQRRQLLGLDAPTKIQPVGDDWTPQEFVIGVTEDELPKPK